MKIALLSFYSGHLERGVETWTHELAHRLNKNGHSVTVVQGGPAPSKKKQYRVHSTGTHLDWSKKSGVGTLLGKLYLDYWSRKSAHAALQSVPHLVRENYDVVIPTNNGWQVGIVRILTWLLSSRMVLVGHSSVQGWEEQVSTLCFPDCYVALSSDGAQWATKARPWLSVRYIPNGVNTKTFTPKGKKAHIQLPHPIILSVAALFPEKRHSDLIDAVSRVKNASLLILGKGPEERMLREKGGKKLGDRFLLSHASYEEMPEYYRAANLFVHVPKDLNAFGLVYLEAMACGIPVVATDDAVRKEIVGDGGLLTHPVPKKLAHTIEKALSNKWGNKPRNQAEKFSWETVTAQYEKLFESIIYE